MKDFLEISQCGNNYYNLPNRKEFPNQEFLTASRKNFQIQNHFFCSEILSIRGKYIQIRRKYITLPLKSFKFYIIEFFFKQRQKTVNNLFFNLSILYHNQNHTCVLHHQTIPSGLHLFHENLKKL